MTVPDIRITAGEYRITASAFNQPIAQALRTTWGWHVALSRGPEGMRWAARDTVQGAVDALHAVAYRWLALPRTGAEGEGPRSSANGRGAAQQSRPAAPSPSRAGSVAVPPKTPAAEFRDVAAEGVDGPNAVLPRLRARSGRRARSPYPPKSPAGLGPPDDASDV